MSSPESDDAEPRPRTGALSEERGEPTLDVDEILFAAAERPPAERGPYLDEVCGADAKLRAEVESLLAAESSAGGFLRSPIQVHHLREAIAAHASNPNEIPALDRSFQDGDRVGAYRLEKVLGAGGMGTVYLAERADLQFKQKVAIKLLRAGLKNADTLRRFENERQVLAGLQHPNIAQLLDGGITAEGTPYLVMEYVDGLSIDRYCDQQAASVEARLQLFRIVCGAVHYAHQNLIVHRDLKPSNILVRPDGVVKLLDFGIAKVLDPSRPPDATVTGLQMMTPRYASPEQVRSQTITTGSDIYSLGVVLYQLLTGRFPYTAEPHGNLVQSICEVPPRRPSEAARITTEWHIEQERPASLGDSTAHSLASLRESTPRRLSRRLSGDLDNVVLKALRKEPERRYGSAEQFADDLQRHLDGRPVRARPDTVRYRTEKFVRRNGPAVAISSAVVLSLGLGAFFNAAAVGIVSILFVALAVIAITSAWLFLRAEHARRESNRQRETSERIATLVMDAVGSINPEMAMGRDVELLREVLDRTAERVDADLRDQSQATRSLHFAIGSAYHSINLFDKAADHLETALALGHRARDSDPDLVEIHRRLGEVESDRGRYAKAESLTRKALQLHDQSGGMGTETRARVLRSLAQVLDTIGQNTEAEQRHREALEIRRTLGVETTPELIECLASLGTHLTTHEKPEEARTILEEAVSRARAIDRPVLLTRGLAQLAFLERWVGNSTVSEDLFRQSLEAGEAVLPPDHPRQISTIHNLASLREDRGDYQGAELLYMRTLESQRRVLGEGHLDVGTTLNNLAGLYRKWERYPESRALYEQAIVIYRRVVPGHVWVGISLGNLALVYELTGQFEDGIELTEEAVTILQQHLPKDHWRIGERQAVLGGCLLGLARYSEAETQLRSALPSLEAHFGPRHAVIRDCLRRCARLYETSGRTDLAAQFRQRLAESDDSIATAEGRQT